MSDVTGCDVLELAGKIMRLCDEHTSNVGIARAAIQIADTAMASRQFDAERELSKPNLAESAAGY